jgi:hypothetical protein
LNISRAAPASPRTGLSGGTTMRCMVVQVRPERPRMDAKPGRPIVFTCSRRIYRGLCHGAGVPKHARRLACSLGHPGRKFEAGCRRPDARCPPIAARSGLLTPLTRGCGGCCRPCGVRTPPIPCAWLLDALVTKPELRPCRFANLKQYSSKIDPQSGFIACFRADSSLQGFHLGRERRLTRG